MFDEMENGEVVRSIGSHLYHDFKQRMVRQQISQQNLEREMFRKMNESKVNSKSQKMCIKKVEKDIKDVIDFVDDQNGGFITFNGMGYVLFFLDVFKIQYNEEYLNKLSLKAGKEFKKNMVNEQALNNFRVISFVTLKNEEQRIQEENFHHRLWKILNPFESDYIEREILNEYLKLMFDPYTPLNKLVPIIKDFLDIIKQAKEMHKMIEAQNDEERDRAPTMTAIGGATDESRFKTPNGGEDFEYDIEDLLNRFMDLYDYKGGNRKIKIPSYKKQKAFYEAYKECTFKPALNKKSLMMGQNKKPVHEAPSKREEVGTIVKANIQRESKVLDLNLK
jgi:hypothetical protein